MNNNYVAKFADGSSSPVEIRGNYGRAELIGVATRGDGKKRVVFFSGANDFLVARDGDPWISNIRVART
jgi:hypothetical protein